MGIIKIDKENIPYKFSIILNKKTYTFEIQYNAVYDFFTIAIADSLGDFLTVGEKLVLNKPILSAHSYLDFAQIIPIDTTREETKITWDNFNKKVFLEVAGDQE